MLRQSGLILQSGACRKEFEEVPEAFDYLSDLNNFSWLPSCLTEAI